MTVPEIVTWIRVSLEILGLWNFLVVGVMLILILMVINYFRD